ncbi:uncharacterized protein DNG_04609 [Cephalotrichum gorgonifer]|uniref:Nephrocystin 3-like N-terminal domain-containing protein n=1 Tax=Cephalotrichum gorgonifer TaxID=2041049 RepID=A0AAE8SUQ4_9PEZI|nr:uncharacterized protein DNG_04609 [Cephalotrichum gorgonifer]
MSLTDSDVDAVVIDRDDISNYNPDQILPLKPEEIQKIRSWLQPTSYDIAGGEYRKHLASHVAGTGAWLTSSDTYQEWLTGTEHGLLWLRGIPGSGKSVIAANLVNEITKANPGSPVLFFFFRQIIDANHEPAALLRDWMDQLLRYSPPLQEKLLKYVKQPRAINSLSLEDMWKDLRMAFAGLPGKVFCVGDALDEMDSGHESFLQALGSLGQWRPETVKVLITSRPVPAVEVPLRNIPCLRLRLEESLVDVDISTYVQSTLSSSAIPQQSGKVIADAVPGRANGLFLYAKLAMDAFLEPGADVATVLTQLPADLNVLYTDLLEEHARRSGVAPDMQHLILQSVTHATRPLRLLELAEMIKFCGPNGSTRDLKAAKDLIRAACGPLLEILPDETVSVIHHSFTEYLKGTTRADDGTGYPVLKPGPTHAQMSLACLRYLQSGCLSIEHSAESEVSDDSDDESDYRYAQMTCDEEMEMILRLKYPFYDYAKNNWQKHINTSEAAGYDQTIVNDELKKFLELMETKQSRINNGFPEVDGPSKSPTKLHLAAKAGLVSYTKKLLQTVQVDERDFLGRTSLWWAASEGHAATIRVLIAAGANPDQDDEIQGLKPLHEAAEKNHFEAVRVLLEAGVDPLTIKTSEGGGNWCGNAPTSVGHTPLMYACENGHLESVDAFMPFIKDVDTVHRALAWASGKGASKVVARILQYPGVDVNATVRGETPLSRACGVPDLATVELLLRAGADPERDTEFDQGEFNRIMMYPAGTVRPKFSCLHKLCRVGSKGYRYTVDSEVEQGIFNLLVQAGADIHRRTMSGETALHGAARSSAVLTRLLLDAGADVDVVDQAGQTPLHLVEFEGPLAVLVEQGHADLNPRDNSGHTPLLNLLSTFHKETSLKFLGYGPDCNIINNKGDGPLHLALREWSSTPDIVRILLESGADPNLKNRDGLTPILTIHDYHRSGELVNLLLEAGADIDSTDKRGRTLLFNLVSANLPYHSTDSNGDMRDLIARGASTSVRDFSGRTLLHEAVRSQGANWSERERAVVPRIDFILGLGQDISAVDHLGNGILHELALARSNHNPQYAGEGRVIQFWEKLIALGLDLGCRNHAGRTPLHLLCSTFNVRCPNPEDLMPIDFVISRTENIDMTDNDGNTPLHLAAAAGEVYVKKLLDAGADPRAATNQGMTPLHLASRSRNPNVVGLLLDAMRNRQATSPTPRTLEAKSSGEATTPPEPLVGVDAALHPRSSITPLYYACRSGRPETVALLLEAGTRVDTIVLLEACGKFEEEDELWRNPHPSEEDERNGGAVALKADDKSRRVSESRSSSWWRDGLVVDETTRLPEILSMLGAHSGTDLAKPYTLYKIGELAEKAAIAGHDYTAACLEEFQKQCRPSDEVIKKWNREEGFVNPKVFSKYRSSEYVHHCHRQASVQGLRDLESIKSGGRNQDLFHFFMVRRDYHLVEELARLGTVFLPSPDSDSNSNMPLLIKHGFASLVESIGALGAASGLETGYWHAFGDATQPGLWFAKRDISKPQHRGSNPTPFILDAVRSILPNMDVLRLLVERFKVDVNELSYVHKYVDCDDVVVPVDSALHVVASGKSWWHVHQALPYLVQAGTDLDVRDYEGKTPLHRALESNEIYAREAARVLIEAGADVNAVDKKGRTCLGYVKSNVAMTEFLISHGATVTADAIFAAIDSASVSSLRALLSGGVDPNICRDKPTPREDTPSQTNCNTWEQALSDGMDIEDGVEPHEMSALYYATRRLRTPDKAKHKDYRDFEKKLEVIQVLLDRGADPFFKYRRISSDNRSRRAAASRSKVPEGYTELTVLHQLFINGLFVDNFLDIPGLDVNRRDARGLTVLLAACHGTGLDRIIGSHRRSADDVVDEGSTTMFQRLLSLGAELTSRDNSGRNALHIMIRSHHNYAAFEKALAEALALAPELINQPDASGKTPLHNAVSRVAVTPGALADKSKLISVLLSEGADPLAVDGNGDTVLHFLAANLGHAGSCAIFRDFVERGVNVNARNCRRETPLWPYCVRDREDLSRGFSAFPLPFGKAKEGREVVRFSEKDDATPMLVGLGADFFARDGRGRGLLHVAANGSVGRFKELMGLGLDPMLEDDGQRTAIDLAAASGNSDVLALFEKGDGVH